MHFKRKLPLVFSLLRLWPVAAVVELVSCCNFNRFYALDGIWRFYPKSLKLRCKGIMWLITNKKVSNNVICSVVAIRIRLASLNVRSRLEGYSLGFIRNECTIRKKSKVFRNRVVHNLNICVISSTTKQYVIAKCHAQELVNPC